MKFMFYRRLIIHFDQIKTFAGDVQDFGDSGGVAV
jgi:hypothetical protein